MDSIAETTAIDRFFLRKFRHITDMEQALAASAEDADMLRIPHLGEVCEPEEDGFEQSEMTRKVNINTASESELMTLPGIGKSKAEAITEYRKKAGGFSCTEDLMKVPGIKEGTFEGIKEQIRTE